MAMSEVKEKVGLSFQHDQYRKNVGYHISPRTGQRVERVWYLGADEAQAQTKSRILTALWAAIKSRSNGTPSLWSAADLATAELAMTSGDVYDARSTAFDVFTTATAPIGQRKAQLAQSMTRQLDAVNRAAAAGTIAAPLAQSLSRMYRSHREYKDAKAIDMPLTVVTDTEENGARAVGTRKVLPDGFHSWLDRFDAAQKTRPDVCKKGKHRTSQNVEIVKREFGDRPMAGVGFEFLEQLANYFKGRPHLKHATGKRGKKAIAPLTVKVILQHAKQAFKWIESASGQWQTPRRFEDLFKVDVSKIQTKKERDEADTIQQLTVDEIKRLYHAGVSQSRLYMMLGIFCGLGQKEIATLRREEFDLVGNLLSHKRNKTGVGGSWYLPPELVELVQGEMQTEGELAFRTRAKIAMKDGNLTDIGSLPLVHDTDAGGSDSIAQVWARLRRKAGVEWAGFYQCRKFHGFWMKSKYGQEVGYTALAQASNGVTPYRFNDPHRTG